MGKSVLGISKRRTNGRKGENCPCWGCGYAGGVSLTPWATGATGLVSVSVVPLHQLVQTESPQEGTVTWKTYHTYIKASGGST